MSIFIFYLILVGICLYAGKKIYKNIINPLTVIALVDYGLISGLSLLVCYALEDALVYDVKYLDRAAYFTMLSLASLFVAHLAIPPVGIHSFHRMVSFLRRLADGLPKVNYWGRIFFCLALIAISFTLLAVVGGGGGLWISSPREAYINYRSGAGVFWAITQWLIMLLLLTIISRNEPKSKTAIIAVLVACSLAYFTGSKNNILMCVIAWAFYTHFYSLKGNIVALSITGLVILTLFPILLFIQGSEFDLPTDYFFDYANTSAWYLSREDEIGHGDGWGILSSIYYLVPRFMVSDKPYEYGVLLIHKELFPGMAETGNTPGSLPWSLYYYDFSVVGIIIYGLVAGWIQKIVYLNFVKDKNSSSFIIAMQWSLLPVFIFTSVISVPFICIFATWLLRQDRPKTGIVAKVQ